MRTYILLLTFSNDRFGFIYSSAYDVLAIVEENHKWGFINDNGKFVVEPRFDYIDRFYISNFFLEVWQNAKRGIIDLNGNILVEPKFDSASNFYASSG